MLPAMGRLTNAETLQASLCIASPLCNGHKRSEIAPGLKSTQHMQIQAVYDDMILYDHVTFKSFRIQHIKQHHERV